MPNQDQKSQLRRDMRAQRMALSRSEVANASFNLAALAQDCTALFVAKRVASYRAFAGEICAESLEQKLNAEIYLPKVIDLKLGQMKFYLQPDQQSMSAKNKLGIMEPSGNSAPLPPQELDVVLMPLVAFQRDGSRIGMGAGLYDRAFAFRAKQNSKKHPILVGLAHSFQETDQLQADPWDVPLDVIITDRELIFV